jgi:hypothetical protein
MLAGCEGYLGHTDRRARPVMEDRLAAGSVPAQPLSVHHRIRGVLRRSSALRHAVVAAQHRGLRADDIFVASYPRSGNTWIRFVLADLATGDAPDFESIDRLIPRVGNHRGAPLLASGSRLVKTHEAHRHEYRRGVYIIRDVRDVLISWYRVTRTNPEDLGEFDDFVKGFMTRRASPYGFWCDHILSWQRAQRAGAEILTCQFEHMRADPAGVISAVAHFVGIPADDEQIARALKRNTVDNMRKLERAAAGYLRHAAGQRSQGVRNGAAGGWRDLLEQRHLRVMKPALELNASLGYPG